MSAPPLPPGIVLFRDRRTGRLEFPQWWEPAQAGLTAVAWALEAQVLLALWVWGLGVRLVGFIVWGARGRRPGKPGPEPGRLVPTREP